MSFGGVDFCRMGKRPDYCRPTLSVVIRTASFRPRCKTHLGHAKPESRPTRLCPILRSSRHRSPPRLLPLTGRLWFSSRDASLSRRCCWGYAGSRFIPKSLAAHYLRQVTLSRCGGCRVTCLRYFLLVCSTSLSRLRLQIEQYQQPGAAPIGAVDIGIVLRGPVGPIGLVVRDAVWPLHDGD